MAKLLLRSKSPQRSDICPKCNVVMKRHRRRDSRFQYKCTKCNNYFTEDSKLTHVIRNERHFDKFIEDYINSKDTKPNIAALCCIHKLSRATVYRHILSPEQKPLLVALAKLNGWAKTRLSGLYKRSVNQQKFILTSRSSNSDFKVKLTPKLDGPNVMSILGETSKPVTYESITSAHFQLSADKKSFCLLIQQGIPFSSQLDQLKDTLTSFNCLNC